MRFTTFTANRLSKFIYTSYQKWLTRTVSQLSFFYWFSKLVYHFGKPNMMIINC